MFLSKRRETERERAEKKKREVNNDRVDQTKEKLFCLRVLTHMFLDIYVSATPPFF